MARGMTVTCWRWLLAGKDERRHIIIEYGSRTNNTTQIQ
jgi:hypothetical protein